jgi:ribonuclease E
MSKEIYISSTPHETRLAIVEDEALTEIYYERENEYTLAGSIYNGRVTRVLPGMQSSFVDIGLERDAFLYITDFMEEAPDSAEFDTTSHGDSAPRAPRLSAPRTEETAAPRGDGGGRSSERGDRGGRGRRGGRDRDRNAARPIESEGAPPQTPREEDLDELPVEAVPVDAQTGDVGEGAPGADGNRRWRGRRGRRRGRGGAAGQRDATDAAAPPSDNESGGGFEDTGFEIDGAAAAEAPVRRAEPVVERAAEPQARSSEQGGREQGRDQGGRDRGGDRSRDGRDGNRGGRDGQRRDQRPPRVPRGFAPSLDRYGVDTGDTGSTGPIADAYGEEATSAEPIILPGESLGKYRKDAGTPAETKAPEAIPVTLAPPANLYTVAAGWDGGAVLPGETLRRRPAEETRPEPRGREQRPERGGRAETRRDDRAGFRREVAPAPESQWEAPRVVEVPAALIAEPQAEPVEPITHAEPPVVEAAQETVAAEPEVVEAKPIVEAEYEPSEAAASYRVDPSPRSEFRQSAPVVEAEEPLPAEPGAELVFVETRQEAAPVHTVTSIAATGEMFSEPVAAQEPAPMEIADEASPIHHEGAVVAPVEAAAEVPGWFAPGAGDLAEEELDEEDFEASPGTIHASSVEEMDFLDEEETLEGAADLGTMLREMSIDQITRTEPEVEEEDDFEEDDLEEDEDEGEEEEEASDTFVIEDGADLDESELSEDRARTGTPEDAAFFESQFGQSAGGRPERGTSSQEGDRRPRRDGGRRDGRRGRSDRDRPRNTGGSGDRDRGRSGHGGGGRRTMQATNLPAISDLLKPGQEILVQIAKEPIAKKGARITSHIALPGRFLVFMPTVSHTGVSRKIESDGERRRLKEILLSEKGDASGGFIVRTAAEGASEEELRSDLRFLLNLWADIKARSESSKSPALIYHDLNLIERILRDQVTDNFSAIWVDSESEYERVLRFLQRFQPSLIRRVKLYSKETPLFEQFGITEEINKALRSKVWLKSGGSIVINQTEALVAIDINTGKFVGKTARLEDTIVKTNLDAIPEIVRQIRLRDLGGIIIIDFIDMDERKNRNRVMAALEDELKSDRAPSKVLQFNDFGLVAITRKRVKQSLERTLSTTCNVCVGTGMVKSPITVCNDIYVEMKKMHKHLERGDVMLRVHPEVVKQLKTTGSKWLQEMEEMCGKTILVKSDPSLHPEQFDIH